VERDIVLIIVRHATDGCDEWVVKSDRDQYPVGWATGIVLGPAVEAKGITRAQIKSAIGIDTDILPVPILRIVTVVLERSRTLKVVRDVCHALTFWYGLLERAASATDCDVKPTAFGAVPNLVWKVLIPVKIVASRDVARDDIINRDAGCRTPGLVTDGPQPRGVLQPPGDVVVVHPFSRVVVAHAGNTGRHPAVGYTIGQVHSRVVGMVIISLLQQHRNVVAVVLVILSTDDVAGGLAGDVLHCQPGLKDAPELDQTEQEQEQERQDQRELDKPLSMTVPFLVYFYFFHRYTSL